MNYDNLAFLKDSLRHLDFPEDQELMEQLEIAITKEPKEFQLHTESHYADDCKMEATLHFQRTVQYEMYCFKKYDARLTYSKTNAKERRQTFYIRQGEGVSFKEAFNLLQGRAVYKENLIDTDGTIYNAWIKLNFSEVDLFKNYKVMQFKEPHRYNLGMVLGAYPIEQLTDPKSMEAILTSLKKGNQELVTFIKRSSRANKMLIEANPVFKTINIFPYGKPRLIKK